MRLLWRQMVSHSGLSRRRFVRALAAGIALPAMNWMRRAWAGEETLRPRTRRAVKTPCDLAVVSGESPSAITRKAIETLGGMGRFVRPGDTVVIKPNIGFNRPPEYASTTNPEVVGTLVGLCRAAGARRVRVFDYTANAPEMCYRTSGIQDAVRKAGGDCSFVSAWKFMPAAFPKGSAMGTWPLYRDAIECDCFINVPIAKHHLVTGLTLSMKNLMGVCGEKRGDIHRNIDVKLAELIGFISPNLTVIDAYRILFRNGPIGHFKRDIRETKTVIAGIDPVLTDAYAATLFNVNPRTIGSIARAEAMNIGSANIAAAHVKKIVV